jgi:hypothetical protein
MSKPPTVKQGCFGEPTGDCRNRATTLCGLCDGYYCDGCIGKHYDAHSKPPAADAPWTDEFNDALACLIEAVESWDSCEIDIAEAEGRVRDAAARAVETRGHVAGCLCISVERMAGSRRAPFRDPRCLPGAKP